MSAILEFYSEGRIHAALEQFKEGLSAIGLLQEMVAHPSSFKELFVKTTTKLTAEDVAGLFKPQFTSPVGSNKRRQETRAVVFWRDWLLEVEGGDAAPISLEYILMFATGLDRVPAVGFSTQPELTFLHEEDEPAVFPTSNTCSLILRIPVKNTYESFKTAMEVGIGNADQFGVQ